MKKNFRPSRNQIQPGSEREAILFNGPHWDKGLEFMNEPDGNGSAPPGKNKGEVLLKLTDVAKTFLSMTQEVEALQPINLEMHKVEFVVLFGPSGCGTSTLLNMIAGFDAPTSGTILLEGK